ncbi:MAG: isoleucine--tRNA ligase [Candidatus Magasanikbacteria bacterium CG10_big_fil_rev_8_21_14_0_10_36_32]|uniref:Isoleucine--tRNA ligase n=1 Tax=Candidatus Magasanikbacteria bacterium CG10_big_fil_rev_8_21_14_0_10_36_32 TaxID=1974646 RepID=A0A2M6W6V5_9BACT|nr:MAG: isoleucine--tRNA ligase [Candidatus Magasanikbacteria bacterium CG10_big_fil_rev_8_21_14_0_10_36_32]
MYNSNKEELEVLKYWDEHQCFEKSISSRSEKKSYHFYDGPPFATGTPHYGHMVASLMKDVVPRYWTMRGYRVERVWGWDCHGLPIENIVEKELGLKSKKDIEQIGIEKFNEACRSKVLMYVEEWKKTIKRFGRWVNMDNAYKTMDLNYMESIWWVFKQLWDKNLIYEGYKSMHICPRCETTLSQQEVTEGYKDVKDISLTAKFELVDESGTYILAWTTTPWTLPGNVALAVGKDIEYVKIAVEKEQYILAKERMEALKVSGDIVEEFKGVDLVGKKYNPLFPYYLEKDLPNKENLYTVVSADFVTTTDGTGVVHIAPAFGEDDMNLGKEKNLPFIQNVLMNGQFTEEVADFSGMNVKPIDDIKKTDVEVIKYLAGKNLLFAKEQYEHSYPHCWRCDTPLINYATSSWFVNVTEIKKTAIPLAEKINWSPAHIKEGRFGKWLEGARDWSISRQRFWASVIPIWKCTCGETKVFGSIEELEKVSGEKIIDLHKHIIDKIEISCDKCGKKVKRIPDVLDCWFESGSMPYAQLHYPFDNKEKFENGFPAEFIAEGVDQTRAWFYYMHIIATAIKDSSAFKNVIANGIVLAEDGKKMSKRLKNYPEPDVVLEKYGADAMRYYLVVSPVMEAENLNFSEAGVREIYNKLINTLWNVVEFYKLYADENEKISSDARSESRLSVGKNILDKWILAKLQILIKEVTEGMNDYKLPAASRPILDFVTELSQWYLRRSRDRFKSGDEKEKQAAIATLHEVLFTLSKVMAPFTPFIAEKIYSLLGGKEESVHLEDWPEADEKLIDQEVLRIMNIARKVVEMGLSLRAEKGIKVRQPLLSLNVGVLDFPSELKQIIAEELNVKEVGDIISGFGEWIDKEDSDIKVSLNIEITEELKKEGLVREIIRTINQKRKDMKLTPNDEVEILYFTDDEFLSSVFSGQGDKIQQSVLAKKMQASDEATDEIEIGDKKIRITIKI